MKSGASVMLGLPVPTGTASYDSAAIKTQSPARCHFWPHKSCFCAEYLSGQVALSRKAQVL